MMLVISQLVNKMTALSLYLIVGLWLAVSIAFFSTLKSAVMILNYPIPAKTELFHSQGTAKFTPYQQINSKLIYLPNMAVVSENTLRFYQCPFTPYIQDCLHNYLPLENQTVSLDWASLQKTSQVDATRLLYELSIDGKVIYDYADAVKHIEHRKKQSLWVVIIYAVSTFCVLSYLLFFITIYIRKTKN